MCERGESENSNFTVQGLPCGTFQSIVHEGSQEVSEWHDVVKGFDCDILAWLENMVSKPIFVVLQE